MLVFTVRFAQLAAVVCKMDVRCITTQQIVYWPVDVSSSVGESGLKSLSPLRSLAYASRVETWALGRGVCIYTYPGVTPSISEAWAPSLSSGGTGGILGGYGIGCGVSCLIRSSGGAPAPLSVWGFCAGPFGPGRQPSVRFSRSIAGCRSIAAFTFICPGKSAPWFHCSWTSAGGYLIRYLFLPSLSAKTLLWPFWPYQRPGACQTVLAVPDPLALP